MGLILLLTLLHMVGAQKTFWRVRSPQVIIWAWTFTNYATCLFFISNRHQYKKVWFKEADVDK